MKRKNALMAITLASVLILSGFSTPAFAATEILYMVSKGGDTQSPSQLWTVDTTTGIATPLPSPVGFEACTSMDFVAGVLHAACESVTIFGLFTENGLISIDHLTGIGTAIGNNGGGQNYGGMSTHPISAILYAFAPAAFSTSPGLGTMSLGTGLFTSIGGVVSGGGNGLAFASDGTLYIARDDGSATPDTINTVSIASGAETPSATIGYVSPLSDGDRTTAMDFSVTNTLWAAIKVGSGGGGTGGGQNTGDTYLATINPTTGAMNTPVLIKDIGGTAIVGVDGIAFLIDVPVGGFDVSINTSALLLAGVQSVSMWMIPVILAGIGIGVFVIKRRN